MTVGEECGMAMVAAAERAARHPTFVPIPLSEYLTSTWILDIARDPNPPILDVYIASAIELGFREKLRVVSVMARGSAADGFCTITATGLADYTCDLSTAHWCIVNRAFASPPRSREW